METEFLPWVKQTNDPNFQDPVNRTTPIGRVMVRVISISVTANTSELGKKLLILISGVLKHYPGFGQGLKERVTITYSRNPTRDSTKDLEPMIGTAIIPSRKTEVLSMCSALYLMDPSRTTPLPNKAMITITQ